MTRSFFSATLVGITAFFSSCSQHEPGIASGDHKDLDSVRYHQLSGDNKYPQLLNKGICENH